MSCHVGRPHVDFSPEIMGGLEVNPLPGPSAVDIGAGGMQATK